MEWQRSLVTRTTPLRLTSKYGGGRFFLKVQLSWLTMQQMDILHQVQNFKMFDRHFGIALHFFPLFLGATWPKQRHSGLAWLTLNCNLNTLPRAGEGLNTVHSIIFLPPSQFYLNQL